MAQEALIQNRMHVERLQILAGYNTGKELQTLQHQIADLQRKAQAWDTEKENPPSAGSKRPISLVN